MGKVNSQMPALCGKCKQFFASPKAVEDHIRDKHQGHRVSIYRAVSAVDLRDEERYPLTPPPAERSLPSK